MPPSPVFGEHLSIISFLAQVHSGPRRSVLSVCMCVQEPMLTIVWSDLLVLREPEEWLRLLVIGISE